LARATRDEGKISARFLAWSSGEEISAGSYRTSGLGYGGTDYNRHRYALIERDDVTNLDHTNFRKYDSLSGRWTSPDPLGGDPSDPQSKRFHSCR
jgi:RHS repeat-associated protein